MFCQNLILIQLDFLYFKVNSNIKYVFFLTNTMLNNLAMFVNDVYKR